MQRWRGEGVTVTQIARRLGRSRQTLYNWEKERREPNEGRRRVSKVERFLGYLESRLEKFDLPATVLMRELRERGYEGGITILRDVVSRIKARQVKRVVDRFETEPGRQAQVDWTSCGTIMHGGRRRRLSLLAVTLGYSRTIWARFVVSERRPVLMELLEAAFRWLGGVPRELVFDNLKQVVEIARKEDAAAVIQPGFAAFALHWGFEVVACPPYWPRAKGKVERAIGYIQKSFLEGRSFVDLEDLNRQLERWLAEVANVRVHGTTRVRPVDRLAEDQAGMLPVEAGRAFPMMEVETRRADHDGRISFRGVRYSVDPQILSGRRGEPVEVRVGTDEVLRIYHGDRLVGEHRLMPAGSPPQDDRAHAAARRRMRQQPAWKGPPGSGPHFEQMIIQGDTSWREEAPVVAVRPLSAYEAA